SRRAARRERSGEQHGAEGYARPRHVSSVERCVRLPPAFEAHHVLHGGLALARHDRFLFHDLGAFGAKLLHFAFDFDAYELVDVFSATLATRHRSSLWVRRRKILSHLARGGNAASLSICAPSGSSRSAA